MRGDLSFNISNLVVSSLVSMVVSIIFYDLPNDTSSMYNRSTLLFFLIILNALKSSLEVKLSFIILLDSNSHSVLDIPII
jgi:ATP-binding cassette subfamily G (WHITE) protein 2 (PDR)